MFFWIPFPSSAHIMQPMTNKNIVYGLVLMVAAFAGGAARAEDMTVTSLVERLLTENGKIQRVQCEIRRETEVGGTVVPTLSRVWFERPDRLHVETVTPNERRIVVDGKTIHKWIAGQTNGVLIPLAEAPAQELLQVRRVPATAEEYLLQIRGSPETTLPPEDGFPVRRAYTPSAPHPYTVLALDETGRLARLEFFDPSVRTNRLLQVNFGSWKEVKPGIWISCLQKTAGKTRTGTEMKETLRVSSLAVNEPINPEQFDRGRQAPGVQFLSLDEMAKLLQRNENR